MSKCPRCGSTSQNSAVCEVCSEGLDKILHELSPQTDVHGIAENRGRSPSHHHEPYSTATKIIVSAVLVLIAVSSVGAGIYFGSIHQSSPSCANGALNYPPCNSCGSSQTYNPTTTLCNCTNGAVNPPSCSSYCANNAINPPTPNMTGANASCDRCPDGRTVDFTGICPPQAIEKISLAKQFWFTGALSS